MEGVTEEASQSAAGDGQRRCLYCFQELNEMTDPRQLPCDHIVCLGCLQNDWKLDALECRACSKEIRIESLDLLPKVSIDTTVHQNIPRPTAPTKSVYDHCDVCDNHSKATTYCIDCDKKCCDAHTKTHRDFFRESHKTLKISVFSEKPAYYRNVACKRHDGEVIQFICDKCSELKCATCISSTETCGRGGGIFARTSAGGSAHQYQSLQQTRSYIQSEFDTQLKTISDKIKEPCNLEKKTWQTVDKLTEDCEDMRKQIDKFLEQQIAKIQMQGDKAKMAISEYQAERMAKVGVYINDLLTKVESLESTQNSVMGFIRENHITEIVLQKARLSDKLSEQKSLDTTTEYGYEEQKLVMDIGDLGSIALSSHSAISMTEKSCYTSIKQQSELTLDTHKSCMDLLYNYMGELAFLSSCKVLLSSAGCGYPCRESKSIKILGASDLCCVAQHKQSIFCLTSSGKVFKANMNQISHDGIPLFCDSLDGKPRMSVSNEWVAISIGPKKVLLYNLLTTKRESCSLDDLESISSLAFDSDGTLLILDYKRKTILKYQITDENELCLIQQV